jgi:hypothetical protein
MMFTCAYGAENERWVSLFLKSAEMSGVDYTLFVETLLPLKIPKNVEVRTLPFVQFLTMADKTLFRGELRLDETVSNVDDPYSKFQAFAPLLGLIFSDLAEGYDFWGHCGVELLVGNVRKFLTSEVLGSSDVVSPLVAGIHEGFAVFRNDAGVASVIRASPSTSLRALFSSPVLTRCPVRSGQGACTNSVADVVYEHMDRSGLRIHSGLPFGHDSGCSISSAPWCAECVLQNIPGSRQVLLHLNANFEEVLFCEFEGGKVIMGGMMNEMSTRELGHILQARLLYQSYSEGVRAVDKAGYVARQINKGVKRVEATLRSEGAHEIQLMLFTAIYGESSTRNPWLPMFLRSAAGSGVNYTIICDPILRLKMPDNVHMIHMTFEELTNRLSNKVFDGRPLPAVLTAGPYKIIDFKPFFGYLFPDRVDKFDFWGHIDNDMIMGNLAGILTSKAANVDLMSPLKLGTIVSDEAAGGPITGGKFRTFGPFTIFRNTPPILELFRHAKPDLESIFTVPGTQFFDEWGQGWNRNQSSNYRMLSMTNIANTMQEQLNLRFNHKGLNFGWDGGCSEDESGKKWDKSPNCGECQFTTTATGRSVTFARSSANTFREVLFCHFQYGKKRVIENFKTMPAEDLKRLQTADVSLTFKRGIQPIT